APWAERLGFSADLRARMLLDGLFTLRHKLKLIPSALLAAIGRRRNDPPQLALTDENQVLPPARKGIPDDIDPRAFDKTVESNYERFEIQPVLVAHVARLA